MISIDTTPSGFLKLTTPYHPRMVADIKKLHVSKRKWDDRYKIWIIDPCEWHTLHEILSKYFGDEMWNISQQTKDLLDFLTETTTKKNGPRGQLFVTSDAPMCVVKAAYRALSQLYHPDKGGSVERMSQLNNALEAVIGEEK